MDVAKLRQAALPANLGQFIVQATQKSGVGHHIDGLFQEAKYKGHRIQIHTQCEIRVDGRRWHVPFGFDNAGYLYCAVLPHQQFRSMLELVSALTEQYCVAADSRTTLNKPHVRQSRRRTRKSCSTKGPNV